MLKDGEEQEGVQGERKRRNAHEIQLHTAGCRHSYLTTAWQFEGSSYEIANNNVPIITSLLLFSLAPYHLTPFTDDLEANNALLQVRHKLKTVNSLQQNSFVSTLHHMTSSQSSRIVASSYSSSQLHVTAAHLCTKMPVCWIRTTIHACRLNVVIVENAWKTPVHRCYGIHNKE